MPEPRSKLPHRPPSVNEALPRLSEELLEAKARALLGALGALDLYLGRRLLPPQAEELHPPFEILLSIGREGGEAESPPPPAYDRLLGEGCSFRLDSAAPGPLARWLRRQGGGALCGWALPRDRWPSVALLARVRSDWDPGPVRLRVAQRGMEALARCLCPPSWWLRSSVPSSEAAPTPPSSSSVIELNSLREAKLRVERQLLQHALRTARGNKTEAARRLQLSRQGLYRKLKRHGLQGEA